jgi:hypothetical protein
MSRIFLCITRRRIVDDSSVNVPFITILYWVFSCFGTLHKVLTSLHLLDCGSRLKQRLTSQAVSINSEDGTNSGDNVQDVWRLCWRLQL